MGCVARRKEEEEKKKKDRKRRRRPRLVTGKCGQFGTEFSQFLINPSFFYEIPILPFIKRVRNPFCPPLNNKVLQI